MNHSSVRWGAQTELAIANFPVSGIPVPRQLIEALAMIKAECAAANAEQGVLLVDVAEAIIRAANEILAGDMADQFPVDVFQTGSGTSTNMNMNEVLASRASEVLGRPVHPNDHVNASQSSNDTFPSAMRVSTALAIIRDLIPALDTLAASLCRVADDHHDTVKLARTHLMDATPMTFGQEVGGWRRAVELGSERLAAILPRLCELPIGGTAVGTGMNAPAGFGLLVTAQLSARVGVQFVEAVDHFEAQSSQDAMVEASAVVRVVAISLNKIAGDLRLLASGPNGGLGEILLPALQAGSSMMPGKVNPVMPEMVQQVAAQVVGNDATVIFATASCSALQLTTAMPIIARSVLSSVSLLGRAASLLAERCIDGLQADRARMLHHAMASPALATIAAPRIGYDAAATLVHDAVERGVRVADVLAERGEVPFTEADLLHTAWPHGHHQPDREAD